MKPNPTTPRALDGEHPLRSEVPPELRRACVEDWRPANTTVPAPVHPDDLDEWVGEAWRHACRYWKRARADWLNAHDVPAAEQEEVIPFLSMLFADEPAYRAAAARVQSKCLAAGVWRWSEFGGATTAMAGDDVKRLVAGDR